MTPPRRRIVPAHRGADGYRRLVDGFASGRVVREELSTATPDRADGCVGLLAFAHLTDLHVMDARSPARVEYLDRFADPDLPTSAEFPHLGVYRPQEGLTTHVVEAMVQAVNGISSSPVLGRPLEWTVVTGDSTDNCQANELAWYLTLLEGGPITPASGDPDVAAGVGNADPTWFDERYWHPDGSPPGLPEDLPHRRHGFPSVPGLLAAAAQPFHAIGLDQPWYAVYGNHDAMLQGTEPPSADIAALGVGGQKRVAAASEAQAIAAVRALGPHGPAALDVLGDGPAAPVPPDPRRRFVDRTEWVAAHFGPRSRPYGHGLAAARPGAAAYAFDAGVVRALVLDTVNPHGGWHGSLDRAQLSWLAAELAAGSSTVLDADGQVTHYPDATDRLFVLFSHHPLETLTNGYSPEPDERVLSDEVGALLLRHPNVVLWVSGHVHRHWVRALRRPAHWATGGGFWQISTTSQIDWPQQGRLIELALNKDATLSIFGTVLDHAAPADPGPAPRGPLGLAALSRELAANDWQRDVTAEGSGLAGGTADRNVELLIAAPDWLVPRGDHGARAGAQLLAAPTG